MRLACLTVKIVKEKGICVGEHHTVCGMWSQLGSHIFHIGKEVPFSSFGMNQSESFLCKNLLIYFFISDFRCMTFANKTVFLSLISDQGGALINSSLPITLDGQLWGSQWAEGIVKIAAFYHWHSRFLCFPHCWRPQYQRAVIVCVFTEWYIGAWWSWQES